MTGSMSRRSLIVGAGATGMLVAASGGPANAVSPGRRSSATATVMVNGKVYTGTKEHGHPEAVAIGADGRIQEVGTTRQIRRRIGRGTQVIDAQGGTIMSGIHDGHMHPLGAAAQSLNPSLHNASMTVPELQAALQALLDASTSQEPDGWLQITDWSPVGLLPAGTVANKSFLDALKTSRPIYLQGSDFHNSFVNSRALALAGIDATTPSPSGGEIVRDASGEATGLLKDNAQGLVRAVIPEPTPEQLEGAYAAMATFLLSNGVTSFMDAACGEDSLQSYADLIGRNLLPQQVTPALVIDPTMAPSDAAEYLGDLRNRYGRVPGMHVTTAKVFLDGVMEFPAQTAALLTPYLDADGRPTDNYGDLYAPGPAFKKLMIKLDRHGWQVHSHAIGDRAVRVGLDGYEAAAKANGRHDRRHTIAHLQLVHPKDYRRFAALGVIGSMQLQWAVRNVFTLDALEPYIGAERFKRLYPARSLVAAGMRTAGGSDWPVDPFRPFNQIATAIDRTSYQDDPRALNAGEGLTRDQSLRMHTRGAAFQLNDSSSGIVAPGKRADLIALDRDITKVAVDDIRGTTVRHTVVAGRVVYSSDSSDPLTKARPMAAAQAVSATMQGRTGSTKSCCGRAKH